MPEGHRAASGLRLSIGTMGDWRKLVEAASLAPSPHNTQPWLVHATGEDSAELYVPAGRTLPHTDSSGAFMTSAVGCFVEALDVAAGAAGLQVEIEPLYPKLGARAEPRPLFGRLRLVERRAAPRDVVEQLRRRQTARGAYDGRAAAPDTLAALERVAAEAGHRASFTSDEELVDFVVGLNADTLFYDLDDDATRAEIGRWIRSSNRRAAAVRDGFSPATLGFPGPLVHLFFFHHRLFAPSPVRLLVKRLFLHTTRGTRTVGWMRGPWQTPGDWFAAGRMLMRFWLELTRHGLYLQPFGSVVTNPTAHALMAERLAVEESDDEVWLLLRIGYCSRPPRSHRLPAAEVLV
jgi:hypothetical protein